MTETTSKRPYLIRAMHEWMMDNGLTPHIVVDAEAEGLTVPDQYIIDGKIDRRRKGVYGPPQQKKMVVMVDDLNMPKKDLFGSQPPLELLRQWMEHKFWFDLDKSLFLGHLDVQNRQNRALLR